MSMTISINGAGKTDFEQNIYAKKGDTGAKAAGKMNTVFTNTKAVPETNSESREIGMFGNENAAVDKGKNKLSKKAQKDRDENIAYLKENDIKYKENKDGSIEYDYADHHEKLSWNGDNSIVELTYEGGIKIEDKFNHSKEIQSTIATNEETGLRQETVRNADGNVTMQNYKKDASGKYVSTNEFMLTDLGDNLGKVYTGADIAKLFNSEGFDPEEFFKFTAAGAQNVDLLRDGGSVHVLLNDGTAIFYENGIGQNGNVCIKLANGEEYYDKDGNLIAN